MLGLSPFFDLLERHPGRVFWCVGLAFVALYVSSHALFPREGGRIINGDRRPVLCYLRSWVVDGDLDFQNDYRLLYEPEGDGTEGWATVPATGRAVNLMSVGPALLWSPLFLFVGVCARALGAPLDGLGRPVSALGRRRGHSVRHGRPSPLLRRVFDARSAFWAALTAWLATSAVYYTLVSPAYSHAVSLFAVALFCHTWLRTRDREGVDRYVLMGALGGLVVLVRWQDVIVLSLPLVHLGVTMVKRKQSVVSATLP